jgi:hypothetical protein
MIKKSIIFSCLIMLAALFSCKKNSDTDLKNIVINEIMPVNLTYIMDENGNYNDWIELYNLSSSPIDMSGCYLSDKRGNTAKWKIPAGTSIEGNGYLIIWADKDTLRPGLHANFKLSDQGETITLGEPNHFLIDEVSYPAQTLEISYSRNPNGTGKFKWQNPTFNRSNNYLK